MKKKVFTSLLLAGALLVLPMGGQFQGLIASATSNNSSSNIGGGSGSNSSNVPVFNQNLYTDLQQLTVSGGDVSDGDTVAIKEAVNTVLDKYTGPEIEGMMLSGLSDVLAQLDQKCLGDTVVKVEGDAVSAKIEMGAGLNTITGDEVALVIAEVPAAERPSIPSEYRSGNAVVVDLDVKGLQKPLDHPIMISADVPDGINASRMAVLHFTEDGIKIITPMRTSSRTVAFCVDSFSVFAFVERRAASTGDSSSSDDSSDNSSAGGYIDDVENQIKSAASGATVKISGITALSNGMMKALLEKKDVTLVMEYTYEGKDYTVVIPAGAAVNDDIPWYGPLYLAGRYGNSTGYTAGSGSVYSVQSGDTMSKIAKVNHMTLAQLAAKNPQVKNIDLIRVGQKINL